MLGRDARLMPAKYLRPYSKGQKNDFRDADPVQRRTMKFLAPAALRVVRIGHIVGDGQHAGHAQ